MDRMWDVVVIGAGVAGLTAARSVAAAALSVACIDRMGPGGVLMNVTEIHDFPAAQGASMGADLVAHLLDGAMAAGVEMMIGEVTALVQGEPWRLWVDNAELGAKAIVIATGLGHGRLGIAGEAAYEGRGLSHCASCDGPLYAGERVVVVGDDKWALQEAIDLARMTDHVSLVASHPIGEAAGRLRAAGVTLVPGHVVGLSGEDGVTGVLVDGPDGRHHLEVLGVFAYSDRRPGLDFADGLLTVESSGRIRVDADMATGLPLLFAAGDVRAASTESVGEAIRDGERAGSCLARLLQRS
ncbi:MAG: FAD-binding protein [Alphaproteobacteria bacterium]|nr:FAD-binding protein [Alphaproteobacteria bacterium]